MTDLDAAARQSTTMTSTPAASRTVTGIHAPHSKSKAGLVLGILGATLLAGAAVAGTMVYMKKKEATAKPAEAPVLPAPTTQAPAIRGAIAVASDPPGATVWINGEQRSETTPATITKLPIGQALEVKIAKEGYAETTTPLTLTESEPSSAISVVLKRGTMGVEVVLRPQVPGAGIIVDGKPQTGMSADGFSAGEQHKLVVFANGYTAQQLSFSGNVGEKKRLEVTLVKADPKDKDKPTTAPTATAAGGSGKLNVSAKGGWCNVAVDGAGRGPTPVAGLTLSAGNHSVTCTTETGKTLSASVNVPADGTARFMFTIPQ
jgi:serine/threonine-protein kinase